MYVNGNNYVYVPYARFSAYYMLGNSEVEVAIPQNLQMVAGNPKGTDASALVAGAKVEWECEGDAAETKDKAAFPSKTCSTHLQALLYFPDCVDQSSLKTAYSGRGSGNGCKFSPRLSTWTLDVLSASTNPVLQAQPA